MHRTLKGLGKTALLVTHDLAEAAAMSDRIIVLGRNPGRIRRELELPGGQSGSLRRWPPASCQASSLYSDSCGKSLTRLKGKERERMEGREEREQREVRSERQEKPTNEQHEGKLTAAEAEKPGQLPQNDYAAFAKKEQLAQERLAAAEAAQPFIREGGSEEEAEMPQLSAVRDESSNWIQGLHVRYKQRRRRITAAVGVTQALILILFIGLWRTARPTGLDRYVVIQLPDKDAAAIMADDGGRVIWPHIGMTVTETVAGFALGTLLGTAIAALLWWFPFWRVYAIRIWSCSTVCRRWHSDRSLSLGLGPALCLSSPLRCRLPLLLRPSTSTTGSGRLIRGFIKVVRLFGASRAQLFRLVILPASRL